MEMQSSAKQIFLMDDEPSNKKCAAVTTEKPLIRAVRGWGEDRFLGFCFPNSSINIHGNFLMHRGGGKKWQLVCACSNSLIPDNTDFTFSRVEISEVTDLCLQLPK